MLKCHHNIHDSDYLLMLIDDFTLGLDMDEQRLKCNDPENFIQRFTLGTRDPVSAETCVTF